MFKLLPEKEKRIIKKEYNLRRFVVVTIFVGAIFFIAIITILPSYITSIYKREETSQIMENTKKLSDLKDEVSINNQLSEINDQIKILEPSLSYVDVFMLIQEVTSVRGNSIKIENILLKKEKEQYKLTISGIADNRESLLTFKRNLDNTEKFLSVDLPISNFAKDVNIDFTMILTPKK